MKLIHCAPPVILLIIAVAWVANLRDAKTALERENALLSEKVAKPRASLAAQQERAIAREKERAIARDESDSSTPDKVDKPSGDWVATSRDWNRLVLSNNDESQYSFRYTAAWKRLEKLASEMGGEELTKAYVEMSTLPVNAPFRNNLESVMLRELEKKNPEFAFSQYIVRNQDGGIVIGGYGSFDEWLARDPAAATNWYASQLAAGTFDKSLAENTAFRLPFESALIVSLLESDPTAAEQIMNKIPADLRGRFGDYVDVIPKEKSQLLVDLLRKTMPVEEYMEILRETSVFEYNFRLEYNSDPENAKRILDSFAVTPEERSALLASQFSKFAEYRAMRVRGGGDPRREEFDANRKWVQAVDPSSADRATGMALQTFLRKANNPESQDFVEKTANDYLNSGAGDALLVPLIEASANGSVTFPKDKARGLAMKISDDKLREELLQKLN
jgi:hypothetical protein